MARKEYNRSRIEIIHDILEYIDREGLASKTHILYATNLNTRSLEKFMEKLLSIGAINLEEVNGRRYYSITSSGQTLLKLIIRVHRILETREEDIDSKGVFIEIIRTKLELSFTDNIKRNVIVEGYSGIQYKIEYLIDNTAIIPLINKELYDEEEILSILSKYLLLTLDTDLICLCIISSRYEYFASMFKTILRNMGLENRYKFLVT